MLALDSAELLELDADVVVLERAVRRHEGVRLGEQAERDRPVDADRGADQGDHVEQAAHLRRDALDEWPPDDEAPCGLGLGSRTQGGLVHDRSVELELRHQKWK